MSWVKTAKRKLRNERQAMDQERLNAIADQLLGKAIAVDDGFYGEDEDNEYWAADLRRAAKRLRLNLLQNLNRTDLEEIACCADITEAETEWLIKASEEGQ